MLIRMYVRRTAFEAWQYTQNRCNTYTPRVDAEGENRDLFDYRDFHASDLRQEAEACSLFDLDNALRRFFAG